MGAPLAVHLDLHVVHLAHERSVGVDQLVIEEVQRGEQDPRRGHVPALVTIINGIVATDTTTRMTRNTLATALRKRPFTCSPM